MDRPDIQQVVQSKRGLLLCLTYYLPNVSGLTLSAHALGRYFAAKGVPVTALSGRSEMSEKLEETIDGIKVVRVNAAMTLGKALLMPGYFLAALREAKGKALVSIHLPCLDAGLVAIAARLRGCKLVLTYTCCMSTHNWSLRLQRAIAAVSHIIAGILADRIQVVSMDYAEQSIFCRLFRKKLSFAPLPFHLHLFQDEGQSTIAKTRQPTAAKPYRIGYVGRIARQKNLDVLLDALPHIVDLVGEHVVIDLIGPSSEVVGETYWQGILDRATRLGGQVIYRGTFDGAELAAAYRKLDVLVLPSTDRLESYGLVQPEAMLRGVPVATSDLPGMRLPIVLTGMGYLFAPGNPSGLAAVVAKLLIDGPPCFRSSVEIERILGDDVACRPYAELLGIAH
jgi:glycosyltransferase involved in cell wall biosynthesis